MKISNKQMIQLLSEEYEKRINHYLNLSEIEIKDKNDNDLVSSAKGLKLKDKAGFLYTLITIIKDEAGNLFARLAKPGIELVDDYMETSSTSPIYEVEKEEKQEQGKKSKQNKKENEKTYPNLGTDIIPKNKDMDFKRSFVPDMSNNPAESMFGNDQNEEYIDVPIEDLKDFTL